MRALFLLWFSGFVMPLPAAPLLNGDFSAGLSGWSYQGDVVAVAGEARLGEGSAVVSAATLYQAVPISAGRLSFDFRGDLSAVIEPTPPFFGIPDTFAATLYFVNDPTGFSLDPNAPVFDDFLPLFDLDYLGVFNLDGQVGPSPNKGAAWQRYTRDFAHLWRYAIPAFELFDANGRDDSRVWIDNVTLAPVPVALPPVTTLIALALVPLLAVARRRRRA